MKYLPANRIFMFFPSGLVVYCNHLVLRDSVQGWRIRAIRYNPSRQTARLVTWQSITVAHSFRFSIEQGGHLFRTLRKKGEFFPFCICYFHLLLPRLDVLEILRIGYVVFLIVFVAHSERISMFFREFDFSLAIMSSAVPKVLVLGHSFVRRLQSDLEGAFDARADRSFNLEGTATVQLFGVGGRTVPKLRRLDLHVVRRLAPEIVILEIGTNDLSSVKPETVGSSIEELVLSILANPSVNVVGVCHVIPRGVAFEGWEEFLRRAEILNDYLSVVLQPISNAFCWTHRDFSSPYKDVYLEDGVHVNALGQYFLYRSYRGAILKALNILRS